MQKKEYKYPNIISFFLILSPLIFSVLSSLITVFGMHQSLSGSDISSAFPVYQDTGATLYFFSIGCASLMVLFGNKNKYLYPIGIAVALVATAGSFFNKSVILLLTKTSQYYILNSIIMLIIVVISIAFFISVMMAMHHNKKAQGLSRILSAVFFICMILTAVSSVLGLKHDAADTPYIMYILTFLKHFMYINIPITIYILVQHALATDQLQNGNLKLENK